ncbi:MAG: acyl-CoA dehydratase activase-related protein [Planctomycetota bacterium]|nr:acyl-CoA dehydratase activase-related protein [Planctomycetota bacterium]
MSTQKQLPAEVIVGLDVGSTTVKAVVMHPETNEILWSDYRRHETKQPEKVLEFLGEITAAFPLPKEKIRIFITGSGGGSLAALFGAKFVQEVNAVSLAVEVFYPTAGSVIELGGQDAKIIIWKDDPNGGKRKIPSMNDKCAGGTGAVIDKINAKVKLPIEELIKLSYHGVKLHPVAGKCGVFAETDINGLQKQGVPPTELMASLFEAIVQQNLSVLTRGNTLRPVCLLLGGPNTFIPAMQEAWRHNIMKVWEERKFPLPEDKDPNKLIVVPDNAQYFAAIGAVLYGKSEDPEVARFTGLEALREFVAHGRDSMRAAGGAAKSLSKSPEELAEFKQQYTIPRHEFPEFKPGEVVEGWIGIDGGSTSTKAVLLNRDAKLIGAFYQLSKGNPIEDTKEVLAGLRDSIESQGATLKIMGVGTTGYAKDILKDTIGADVALVETVAHTQAALHFYDNVDVIVDVGGQDIKVIMLKNGRVSDFKLNTQCSAGNGYFLQSTSSRFGHPVEKFADIAFQAKGLPVFSYGCAVFMESDIVNFQQLGWSADQIMAGLAHVLPKNIWLYVVQEPNLAKLGRKFVLQGGTQRNLAAVKAQVDFIKSKVPDAEVIVHKFCGESGAIGCAIESIRVTQRHGHTHFIGMDALLGLGYSSKRDESTRCYFCKNKCLRTFIDTKTPAGDERRFIIATCEKGTVEDVAKMREIKGKMDDKKKANPNFVDVAAKKAFTSYSPKVALKEDKRGLLSKIRLPRVKEALEKRARISELKVGMPRALNMYNTGPFWSAYFEAIGINPKNIYWSDYTNEELYKKGSRRGSIDQCFPAKVSLAHVHDLVYAKKKPDAIFFPIPNTLQTDLTHMLDSCACPTVTATPEVVKAAFTKEGDIFKEQGIEYWDPVIDLYRPALAEKQLFKFFNHHLGISKEENGAAVQEAYKAMDQFKNELLRKPAREVLERLKAEGKLGVVLLARPYHNDPGLNHEIVEELQMMGYPIFSLDSLPIDEDILEEVFGADIRAGRIPHGMAIMDVWKNAYSTNSAQKLWAAKYVARHPNLIGLDLSSFKCGHDAPIYSAVEEIVTESLTPYFTFHDIDENKPTGAIKIRTETIDYFLKRYIEDMQDKKAKAQQLREKLEAKKRELIEKQKTEQDKSDPALAAVSS